MPTGLIKVLILEDDSTLVSAMTQALQKVGCEVFSTEKMEEASQIIRRESIRYVFVDCLLPTGSGVDYIQSIRSQFSEDVLEVILMSGILNDPAFMKDSIRSAKAASFLKKPFELKEVIACIKDVTQVMASVNNIPPRRFLYQLLSKDSVSTRQKRKAIESLEEIHGFDLPYIYSLMVETNSSGHLNIIYPKGDVCGVSFSGGRIIGVDTVDQETYLGKLLIESGYILPADLEQVLSATSSKKIGERLIQASLLSPHAFDIVLSNQMKLRLSRTIQDIPVKLTLVFTDVELTKPNLDSEDCSLILHDWIASKITVRWLKEHYNQFLNQTLEKGPNYTEDLGVLQMPLIASQADLIKFLVNGQTLREIFETSKFPEDRLYKALHLLLVKGILVVRESKANTLSPEGRAKILKRLQSQMITRSKFEQFDMMIRMTGGSESDPKYVYETFIDILGPPPTEKATMDIYNKLNAIAEAFKTAGDLGQIGRIKEEIQKSENESRLMATRHFDEAKALLQRAQYEKALELMKKALDYDPSLEKNRLYLAWVKIGLSENGAKGQWLNEAEMDLMQATPEEKFDAIYSLVNGLLCKAKGDMFGAKKNFEKATAMDSTLVVARRELTLMQLQASNKDQNKGDLKDIVSGFFKRK